MWSGPRNVSTALMRAFEARGDCAVVDEPLYAAFLAATGVDHPGRDEVLASQPTDPEAALTALAADPGTPLQFEKHMAHHWQKDWPTAALGGVQHALLIRDPTKVVASYARVRGTPSAADLGLLQQEALLDVFTQQLEQPARIIDSDHLRADPAGVLAALCDSLGIPYTPRMLTWPAGLRPTDGVWAQHWYGNVAASTGFAGPDDRPAVVPAGLQRVVDTLQPAYDRLSARRR